MNFVFCPHCDRQISDVWKYFLGIEDGDSIEIECPDCDKLITLTLWQTITYEARPGPESL